MLLGVFWHAAFFGYFLDGTGSIDLATETFVVAVHAFRMPLFFVMAGFFAALLVERAGPERFVRVRLTRIALPLLVAWLTVVPLTRVALGDPALSTEPGIVWFLWYLLLFYALALGVRRIARRPVAPPVHAVLLAVPTALVLWWMPGVQARTPSTWVPDPSALAYYGLFFAFGWLLWAHRDLLPAVGRRPAAHLAAAALLAAAAVAAVRKAEADAAWEPVASAVLALLAWTAVFGAVGLFQRVLATERPRVRYLADSAYWLYLTHGPLVIVLDRVLLDAGAPLAAVVVISGVAACGLLLAAYEGVVRYGRIGAILHGPRRRGGRMDEFQGSRSGVEMPIQGR